MTRGERHALDEAVDEAFPRLRREVDADLVPEREARALGLLGPGERYALSEEEIARAASLRRDLLVVVRECGRVQTARPVDTGWVLDAARALGEAALGVVGWSLGDEQVPEALEAVLEAAKAQLKADQELARSDDDIPF